MSFFGADGHDNIVRQLKKQLSDKDAQLHSIQNELLKKDHDLADAKRGRDDALYKVQMEADRAIKAEKALTSKQNEFAQLRTQTANLEQAHHSANDKLKIQEKEISKLQYQLDCSSGNDSGSTKRMLDEKARLEAKVQTLESALKRSEEEKENIKTAPTSSWGSNEIPNRNDKAIIVALENDVQSLRAENTLLKTEQRKSQPPSPRSTTSSQFSSNIFGTTSPRANTRRRASSVSSLNRIQELESEVESLRSAMGPSGAQLDTVKTKLANAQRELLKAENDKLRLEKQSQREIEELKSRIEDITYEVENYRRDGGGVSKEEVEKVKKTAQAEREVLAKKVEKLEAEIQARQKDIAALERKVARMEDLEAELAAKSTISPIIDSDRINVLENDLAAARAELASSSTASSDTSLRQLQRKLSAATREIEQLQQELKENDDILSEKEAEIFALKSAIPIPGSPIIAGGRLEELEDEVDTVRRMMEAREAEAMDRISVLETELAVAKAELGERTEEIRVVQAAFDAYRGEMETFSSERESVEKQLQDAEAALALKSGIVYQLELDLAGAKELAAAEANTVSSLREEVLTVRTQLEETDTLQFGAEQDRKAAAEEVGLLAASVADLESRLSEAETRLVLAGGEYEGTIQSLRNEIEDGQTSIQALQLRLEDAQMELVSSRKAMEDLQNRLDDIVTINAGMEETKSQLENKITELQDDIANRSTESEARDRDEQLFDLKEQLVTLEKTLATVQETHQHQLASIQISRTQAIATRDRRILDLEKGLTELQKSTTDPHSTILRLRAERDELKQSVSYAQHERHFGVRAADADKAGAVEELQKVRNELKQVNAASEVLRGDVEKGKSRLEDVLGRLKVAMVDLAASSSEREVLETQAKQLQLDLDQMIAEREVEKAQLESRLSEMERSTDLDAERSQAKLIMDLVSERDTSLQKVNDLTEALESERHAKLLLEKCVHDLSLKLDSPVAEDESSVAFAVIRRLKDEHEDKLKRRNDQISKLQAEVQKTNFHWESAKEDMEGLAETIASLTEERDNLRSEVEHGSEKLVELTTALDSSKLSMIEKEVIVAGLESRLTGFDTVVNEHMATIRRLVLAIAVQTKQVRTSQNEIDRLHLVSDGLSKQHTAEVDRIATEKGIIETELETTKSRLEADLDPAKTELDIASAELQQVADDLEASKTEITRLGSSHTAELQERARVETERVAALEKDLNEAKDAAAKAWAVSTEMENRIATLLEAQTELKVSLDSTKARVNDLEEELRTVSNVETSEASKIQYQAQIETLSSEKALTEVKLAELATTLEEVQSRLAKAEKESKSAGNLMRFKDNEVTNLSAAVKTLRDQLSVAQEEATKATTTSRGFQSESFRTTAEISRLKAALTAAEAPNPDLQERITELEASLTRKVQEVDEADDRVRDLHVVKTKLEKKVAKLQRQLAAATPVETNTKTTEMAPPAVPRSAVRSHNVFEPSQTPTMKRGREEQEENLPAECIMLPPTSQTKKTPARTAFTPQRGVFKGPNSITRNVFGTDLTNQSTTPSIRNVFAKPDPVSVTRNVFEIPQ